MIDDKRTEPEEIGGGVDRRWLVLDSVRVRHHRDRRLRHAAPEGADGRDFCLGARGGADVPDDHLDAEEPADEVRDGHLHADSGRAFQDHASDAAGRRVRPRADRGRIRLRPRHHRHVRDVLPVADRDGAQVDFA